MSTRFLSKAGWFLGALIFSAFVLFEHLQAGDSSSYYGKRMNWNSLAGGTANISTFAFRDTNKNGVYDLEDRPMAGVAFELQGPNSNRVFTRSNIDGFGNFKMSVLNEADIRTPGEYNYRAMTPPGWELTSGNGVQQTSFKVLPGSLADIVSSTPAAPVGFAQSLSIAGRVKQFTPSMKLTAIAPSGEKKDIPIGENGYFIITATKGNWLIEVRDVSGGAKRAITVINTPVVLSRIVLGEPESEVFSHTRTLGFDDLIASKSVLEIPSGYGDISWRNWVATHNHYYEGPGYINNTMSGEYIAYNSSGHPTELFDEKPFNFLGGYFGVGWDNAEGETLLLEGWRGDNIVYYDEVELSALGPVYFAANYTAVTRLKFSTLHYWQFVCDDITFGLNP